MIKVDLGGAEKLVENQSQSDLSDRLNRIVNGSGFTDLSSSEKALSSLSERAHWIRDHFQRTIIVGIGGSAWAPISVNDFFRFESSHQLCFLDGPDAFMFRQVMGSYQDLKKSHFIFISKTGTTLETLSLLQAVSRHLGESGFTLKNQATVICGQDDNPLKRWADKGQVCNFEIPANIGGRYSAMTPVGMIAMALIGKDPGKFLEGGRWALKNPDPVFALARFMKASFDAELYVTQMWVYTQRLWALGNWWQQLWSESLSKTSTRLGGPAPRVSTPMVCCGPRDQHSLLQQLMEGYADKSILVLSDFSRMDSPVLLGSEFSDRSEFSDPNLSLNKVLSSEQEGFCGALTKRGIPFVRLGSDFSKEESWGAFFMSWQLAVVLVGEILDVDPFGQPGVELGKELSRHYLKSIPKI